MSGSPRPLTLLLLYATLVVWLTWPLASQLSTVLPNTTPDAPISAPRLGWALAHESRALTSSASFGDAGIFHPTPHALFLGEVAIGALPFFLPAFLLSGNPTLALNVLFLAALAVTACVVHVVVHRWTRSGLAGAVAAWTLLTSRWLIWSAAATPNAALLMYLPAIMLLLATPRPVETTFGLVALVVAQGASGLDMAVSVLVLVALLAGARLVRAGARGRGLHLLAILVFAVPALVLLNVGYAIVWTENPRLLEQRFPHASGAVPLALPWSPAVADLPWAIPWPVVMLAGVGAIIAITMARRSPTDVLAPWRSAAFWTIGGWLLSGADGGALGLQARFGAVSLVGHVMLAGLGFARCEDLLIRTVRPRWTALRRAAGWLTLALRLGLAGVVVFGCYAVYLDGPPGPGDAYPTAMPPSAEDPLLPLLARGSGPVLELPTWRDMEEPATPASEVLAMYRAIFHGRPLLNGYASFWPAGFPDRTQLAARLPDGEALALLRARTDLATIVVHTGAMDAAQAALWQEAAAGGREDLRLVGWVGSDLVLDVVPPH